MRQIFASDTAIATFDLPCRLDTFCQQLSPYSVLSPELLIHQHTLYPYYRHFLPETRATAIFDSMKGETKGGTIHGAIGALASGIHMLSFPRYCPNCIADDQHDFGEAYWHRSHQLPGTAVCYKHLVPLLECGVPLSSSRNRYAFIALKHVDLSGSHPVYPHLQKEIADYLAMASHWLLVHKQVVLGLDELHRRYLELLGLMGLATTFGIVQQKKLLQEFRDYFGEDFLAHIGSPVSTELKDNWLSSLVRKPRKATHPLRHLLLMKFLGTSPDYFLDDDFIYSEPFGAPPFPCLNRAASHYLEAVIPDVRISRNTENGHPVGNFYCTCGFAYARTGPDKGPEVRFKRTRIISMGPVWEAALLKLAKDPSIGLRETARLLGVDTNTIKRYRRRKADQKVAGTRPRKGWMKRSKTYRNRVLKQIHAKPGLCRTELRALIQREYSWLYRNDRDWLNAHLPQSSPNHKYQNTRIDWEKRDNEICSMAKIAIDKLLVDTGKLKRVTNGRVGEMIGHLFLIQKHLDKLPRTKKVLEDTHESFEDFQIRRVRAVARKIQDEGVIIEPWKIIRTAGLRPGFSMKVAEEIEKVIAQSLPQRNVI